MSTPRFLVYQDIAGEWRWQLKAANGEVVASGEGYKTRSGAQSGVRCLKRTALIADVVLRAPVVAPLVQGAQL